MINAYNDVVLSRPDSNLGLMLQRCNLIKDAFCNVKLPDCCNSNEKYIFSLSASKSSNEKYSKFNLKTNFFNVVINDLCNVYPFCSPLKKSKLSLYFVHLIETALLSCSHLDIAVGISKSTWIELSHQHEKFKIKSKKDCDFSILVELFKVLNDKPCVATDLPWNLYFIEACVLEMDVYLLIQCKSEQDLELFLFAICRFVKSDSISLINNLLNRKCIAQDLSVFTSINYSTSFINAKIEKLKEKVLKEPHNFIKLTKIISEINDKKSTQDEEGEKNDEFLHFSNLVSGSSLDLKSNMLKSENPFIFDNVLNEPSFDETIRFKEIVNVKNRWIELSSEYAPEFTGECFENLLENISGKPRIRDYALVEFIKDMPWFMKNIVKSMVSSIFCTCDFDPLVGFKKPILYMFSISCESGSTFDSCFLFLKMFMYVLDSRVESRDSFKQDGFRSTAMFIGSCILHGSQILHKLFFQWILLRIDRSDIKTDGALFRSNLDENISYPIELIQLLYSVGGKSFRSMFSDEFVPLFLKQRLKHHSTTTDIISERATKYDEFDFAIHFFLSYGSKHQIVEILGQPISQFQDDEKNFEFDDSLFITSNKKLRNLLLFIERILFYSLDDENNIPFSKEKIDGNIEWFHEIWIPAISNLSNDSFGHHILSFLSSHKKLFPELFVKKFKNGLFSALSIASTLADPIVFLTSLVGGIETRIVSAETIDYSEFFSIIPSYIKQKELSELVLQFCDAFVSRVVFYFTKKGTFPILLKQLFIFQNRSSQSTPFFVSLIKAINKRDKPVIESSILFFKAALEEPLSTFAVELEAANKIVANEIQNSSSKRKRGALAAQKDICRDMVSTSLDLIAGLLNENLSFLITDSIMDTICHFLKHTDQNRVKERVLDILISIFKIKNVQKRHEFNISDLVCFNDVIIDICKLLKDDKYCAKVSTFINQILFYESQILVKGSTFSLSLLSHLWNIIEDDKSIFNLFIEVLKWDMSRDNVLRFAHTVRMMIELKKGDIYQAVLEILDKHDLF